MFNSMGNAPVEVAITSILNHNKKKCIIQKRTLDFFLIFAGNVKLLSLNLIKGTLECRIEGALKIFKIWIFCIFS